MENMNSIFSEVLCWVSLKNVRFIEEIKRDALSYLVWSNGLGGPSNSLIPDVIYIGKFHHNEIYLV